MKHENCSLVNKKKKKQQQQLKTKNIKSIEKQGRKKRRTILLWGLPFVDCVLAFVFFLIICTQQEHAFATVFSFFFCKKFLSA